MVIQSKMKLIFNPYYDQPVYTGADEGCALGKKYVGPHGLLGELELRAGLSRLYPSQTTRLLKYCEALSQCGQDSADPDALFYWKSFGVDMLNVSRRLLEWRDALVYAGVKDLEAIPEGVSAGAKSILSDILDVEEYFNDDSSVGDRWARLAKESDYLTSDWTIQVRMKAELVDPVILDCLKNSGATCEFVAELPEIGHNVTVNKFANLVDGYQWALTQEEAHESVYVNSDNVTLNGVLTSLGKANVGAEASGVYTQISQLFSSGMKLFISPVDYDALVSYLSVPVHPLNDYILSEDKTLRYALFSHISAQGGFGKNERSQCDWSSIIEAAKPEDGRKTVLALEHCLGQWEKGATLSAIETYCDEWSKWCARKAVVTQDDAVAQQLLTIKDSFDVLPKFLRLTGKDKFTEKELMVNIASAATFCTYTTAVPMLGSLDIVSDIKAIAAPCERTVWMDCYDQGMAGYKYSFLNESDINLMNAAGMMIPTYDKQLQAEAVSKHLAYSYISKELVVLTPEKVECRKSYPQQIPHWDGKVDDKTDWTPEGKEMTTVEANSQEVLHRVTSTIFNGLDTPRDEGGIGRNYESFSSLDMLIQTPFDYVLQYLFKCNETSRTNLSAVKGNVVHKMFNNAVLESGTDWNKLKTALVDNFDENFDKAVNEVGIELLSINNRLTYNLFKNVIKTCSIPSFIKIIEDNDLSVVGSEVDIMVDFETIRKFNAKIDMVLKNPEGKYVIMDFKWTDGKDKKRAEEIENNMEMQLALYAQAVRQYFGDGDDTCVEAIGYFMLRQGVFITEYQGLKQSEKVKVVQKQSTDSIFDMVKKSYEFRMSQLIGESGESVIEEGEQMKVTELGIEGYHDEGDRFPLKGINVKANGGYTGEKSTTYGKNVVLKGMLE